VSERASPFRPFPLSDPLHSLDSSHLTMNNLSHHLLLSHLLPILRKTSELPNTDVRIVQMSSELYRATFGGPGESHGGGKFASENEFREDIGPSNLYARSKLAVILFTKVGPCRPSLRPPPPRKADPPSHRSSTRRLSSNVISNRLVRSSPTRLTRAPSPRANKVNLSPRTASSSGGSSRAQFVRS
jgi:hypothetical protein